MSNPIVPNNLDSFRQDYNSLMKKIEIVQKGLDAPNITPELREKIGHELDETQRAFFRFQEKYVEHVPSSTFNKPVDDFQNKVDDLISKINRAQRRISPE